MQQSSPPELVFAHADPTKTDPMLVPMTQPVSMMPGAPMTSGNNMPAPAAYRQPQEEKTNLSPVYVLLGLVGLLAIICVVLAGMNNGVLTGMSGKDDHAHDLELKMDTVDANLSEMKGSMGSLAATSDVAKLDTKMDEFKKAVEEALKDSTREVEVFATRKPPTGNTNPCAGTKPTGADWKNKDCTEAEINEQAAADVSSPFTGTKETGNRDPITQAYWKAGICPVNVHWHLGAEHKSNGQFDENGKHPEHTHDWEGKPRQGLRCHKYDSKDAKFTTAYNWKHCKHMQVGETYEVHWPHSAGGACGTVHQYQTPFYDGVFCNGGDLALTNTGYNIGVQAQVFTVVNDEDYYYPDLIKGMIIDGDKGDDMVFYTGSTTGDSRTNQVCSKYSPITWQVDRMCHLISASTFDKMCADMKAQLDDMSDDLHPHGAREVVAPQYTADNMRTGSLSGGRASFP